LFGQATYAALASALFGVFAVGTEHDIRTDGYALLDGATVSGLTTTAVCFGVAAVVFLYVGWHVGRRANWDGLALGVQLPACFLVCLMAGRLSLSEPGDLFIWSIVVVFTVAALVTLLDGHLRRWRARS
jgi:hypothetical protein